MVAEDKMIIETGRTYGCLGRAWRAAVLVLEGSKEVGEGMSGIVDVSRAKIERARGKL